MKTGVLIVVPTLDGNVRCGIASTLVDATIRSFRKDCPFAFSFQPIVGYRPQEFALNMGVRIFRETDCEWLWIWDADIEPPADWFDMLKHTETHDMVAGAVLTHERGGDRGLELKVCGFKRNFKGVLTGDPELVGKDVDAAGSGCLLIHRRVLTNPAMRVDDGEDNMHDPNWAPAIFTHTARPNGQLLEGLDTEFTGRATELGYLLMLHQGSIWDQVEEIQLGHVLLSWHARGLGRKEVPA